MNICFDSIIKLEFYGAKVTSDGGLLAYRDLYTALGLFDSVSAVLTINAQDVISNMICPPFYVNPSMAVLQDTRMPMMHSVYQLCAITGKKDKSKHAASANTIGRWFRFIP